MNLHPKKLLRNLTNVFCNTKAVKDKSRRLRWHELPVARHGALCWRGSGSAGGVPFYPHFWQVGLLPPVARLPLFSRAFCARQKRMLTKCLSYICAYTYTLYDASEHTACPPDSRPQPDLRVYLYVY